ncbi:phosphoadenylyl-sulfate reductase [Buchnera aphidicola (Hyadaphis tataricae)]|uniref:Phosphoadenosine 5'-phosphosulfate reductase n=1 Tax=Buchnera aphidicola (Hyadaphis tataricae) TaxID=1241859 RepID=A0A4D6Y5R3_9GAMM|nr:phosphoadenylyl-sulfate reductase [Buchnera aphidicola]QCI21714.1 phosphoadenylyl-sulfate reductase [Buchnera aphidicola (Hyadaphis tataricae)]
MSKLDIKNINQLSLKDRIKVLSRLNLFMSRISAEERVSWALDNLPDKHIISSSFGVNSMVLLHILIQQKPNIPVILIDTGYLFPETYHFIDFITNKYHLNLQVFRSKISPAWQEARYGQLWNKGIQGINRYNQINKVQPMHVALIQLSVQTWFAGLRRDQSKSRSLLPYIEIKKGVFKVLPIVDWSNNQSNEYLRKHNLKLHPLSKDGYSSVGDVHTTLKHAPGMLEEETRFFGLKRECGLHED